MAVPSSCLQFQASFSMCNMDPGLSTINEIYPKKKKKKIGSPRRQFHLQPASPKAKCVAPDRKGPRASGHTCFALSIAKLSNVTSASAMPVARTCLKRHAGNTKDSLCNWVQLRGVNVLLILCGRGSTDLCEDSAIFNRLVHRLFY